MRNEIFKISFTNYSSEKYRDQNPLDDTLFGSLHKADYKTKHPFFHRESVHIDEKTFVDNFANPLYQVKKEYFMIVIEEEGDKISLKIFMGSKGRRVGKPWFKVVKNMEFLTVNKKTGDVYHGSLSNYQNKRKFSTRMRRNYFVSFPASSILTKIKNLLSNYCNNSSEITHDVANKFFGSFTQSPLYLDNDQKLMKFYLDKNNFKYPNNFWVYATHMWGKEYRKLIKKNDKRIVDTFMQIWKVKGKKLKKSLHTCNSLNIGLYNISVNLFGEDWLNQDEKIIDDILNTGVGQVDYPENFKTFLSHEELKRVYSVFKFMISNNSINIWTFNDHVRMYSSLKEFGENQIKWQSDGSDWNKFQEEHLDWTDKLEHYRKGSYTRIYPEHFFEKIQKPIDDFYPVILTKSENYNEESYVQSNCVKGYIGRPSSMIISLRKNSSDSEYRATIEYGVHYLKNSDLVFCERIQTLGKYNQKLDSSWTDVLLKLDEVVLSCFRDKDFKSVSIEKICQNGTRLFSESHFDDYGNLIWSDKKQNLNNFSSWEF